MGVLKVRVRVFSFESPEDTSEVEMVVDTGASYPVIPRELAEELGVQRAERRKFQLADGRGLSVILDGPDYPTTGAEPRALLSWEKEPISRC